MPQQQSSNKSVILLVVLFIILLIVTFFMSRWFSQHKTPSASPETSQSNITHENVKVIKTDLSSSSGQKSKIPIGFPSAIPVEEKTITESQSTAFPDRNMVQSTLSYTTTKTVSQKYAEYLAFMTKDGYTFAKDGKDEKNGFLQGTKGTAALSVSISSLSGKTTVKIAFHTQ